MEIVKFENKRFNEIHKQDNPVFDTSNYAGEEIRAGECILVCRVADAQHSGVKDGFKVIHVPIKGEIVGKGKFWNIEDAMVFAEALASKA